MTVINGFIIVLMLLLMVYTMYRLFKKKDLLMLIPACSQAFAISVAILSFVSDTEALQTVQAAYLLFGIFPSALMLVSDYARMVKRVKKHGVFNGLIEAWKPGEPEIPALPAEGINSNSGEKPAQDIINELKGLPEETRKNFRKVLNKADLLLHENKFEDAYFIYDTLSKAAGCSPLLCYNTAGLCYKLEKYQEAVENYKRAIERADGNLAAFFDIYYNLGNTYYMLKKYDKACGSYEKALEYSPGSTPAIENLAFAYVRSGEAEKGIDVLRGAKMEENNYRAHFICGKLLCEAGKNREAEEELKKSIRLKAGGIEARTELANVLLKDNRAGDAVSVLEEIIRLKPDDHGALCMKANICGKLDRWSEAAACYKEALKVKPGSSKGYYNMGTALSECGRSAEAAEAFRKSIDLNPDFIDAYNNLGIALSLNGEYEEALEIYEKGIARDNRNFSLFFNMGTALFETGKYIEAASAYRNALDIKPDELEVYYYLGAALTELRHYDDAVDAYKSALEIKPSDGELHYNIAAIYAMLGRYDIAGENLKKAVELNHEIRMWAEKNRAFDGMRGMADFREIVGGEGLADREPNFVL